MYASGQSYNEIIDTMNLEGYRSKSGRSFGKNSLHDILRNEKYTGTYIFNRTVSKAGGKRNNHSSKSNKDIIRVENGMPAIISKELWNEVSKKMLGNKRARAANSAKENYLMSGLVFVGNVMVVCTVKESLQEGTKVNIGVTPAVQGIGTIPAI